MESDHKVVNSICDLYLITMSFIPIYEVIEILIYNSADNTPLTGTYKLNFETYPRTTENL